MKRVLEKSKIQGPRGTRKQDRFGELGEHRAGTWLMDPPHGVGHKSSMWREMTLGATQTEHFRL